MTSVFLTKTQHYTSAKTDRLEQIEQYIVAVHRILSLGILNGLTSSYPEYPDALKSLMKREDSNLYSMLLKPRMIDSYLRFQNRAFAVTRSDDGNLYKALSEAFQNVCPLPGAKAKLIQGVLAEAEEQAADFEGLKQLLNKHSQEKFGINIDYNKNSNDEVITQEYINNLMGFTEDTTTKQEYIDVLLQLCAKGLFDYQDSPFITRQNGEALSIISQFFLASVNIFCRSKNISNKNFAEALEEDYSFSQTFATLILSIHDGNFENHIIDFINQNKTAFALNRELTNEDKDIIRQQFLINYQTIQGSEHFDEFAVLDDSKPGPFVTHQGSICINFAEFLLAVFPDQNPGYFGEVQKDTENLNNKITANNQHVHATIEINMQTLLDNIKSKPQFDAAIKQVSEEQKEQIRDELQKQKPEIFQTENRFAASSSSSSNRARRIPLFRGAFFSASSSMRTQNRSAANIPIQDLRENLSNMLRCGDREGATSIINALSSETLTKLKKYIENQYRISSPRNSRVYQLILENVSEQDSGSLDLNYGCSNR